MIKFLLSAALILSSIIAVGQGFREEFPIEGRQYFVSEMDTLLNKHFPLSTIHIYNEGELCNTIIIEVIGTELDSAYIMEAFAESQTVEFMYRMNYDTLKFRYNEGEYWTYIIRYTTQRQKDDKN